MEKTCFKCGQLKPLTEYYAHKQMADGHLNKCKSCTRLDTKTNTVQKMGDPEWVKKEQVRHRKKYHRLNYLEKHKPSKDAQYIRTKDHRSRFPEKYKAHTSSQGIESKLGHNHHWSYNKQHWRDVIDISPKDHAKAHRFIIYDQERMMYRTLDGVLLDTKERHMEYIYDKIKNEED